jgi:hypothetical protein
MTPDEIAIFNARMSLENSLRGGASGLNPADPALNLNNAYAAPSGTGTLERAAAQNAANQQALSNAYNFSPDANGMTNTPSTSTKQPNGMGTPPSANSSAPNAPSTAATKPSYLPSASQIGGAAGALAGSFAGDAIGDAASAATFGTTNGFGSQAGTAIGGLVGGFFGGGLAGATTGGLGAFAGTFLGSAIGSAVGNFIGSGLDALGGLIFGKPKTTPQPDRGQNYTDPSKLPAATPTQGLSDGAIYLVRCQILYKNNGNAATTTARLAGIIGGYRYNTETQFFEVQSRGAWLAVINGNTPNAGDHEFTILSIIRADGLQDPPPYNDSPNANKPFVPSDATQGGGYSGAWDSLGQGEEYISGTGKRKPKPEPATTPDSTKPSPDKPRQINPDGIPVAPSAAPSPLNGSSPAYSGDKSGASAANSGSGSAPQGYNAGTQPASKGMIPAYASPAFAQPAFASKPYVAGESDPNDYGKEIDNTTGKERIKNPTIDPAKPTTQPSTTPKPNPTAPPQPAPPSPDTGQILGAIAGVAALTTALKIGSDLLVNNSLANTPKIDQIANNTTPANQQANAATGACTALQSPTCTLPLANSIVNPVNANANANQAVNDGKFAAILAFLQALQTALSLLLTTVIGKIDKIKDFLDLNAKVESVKSTITLALTLHNALMLSSSLGDTLGLIIDNVLGVFGNTFRSTEGAQISASSYLGATVKQWIINIVGVDNYVKLSETLANANRVYQTGMNVVSTFQSMLDSAGSVAAATGINVSKIGNALRDGRIVSPQAYTHMDETKEGNRPTTLSRFTQLTTTISDLDSKAQNLVTITAAPMQIKDAIKQSKEDIKAFNDARDVNSTANIEAKQAKIDAIKQLKPLTEATIGKRDDDT